MTVTNPVRLLALAASPYLSDGQEQALTTAVAGVQSWEPVLDEGYRHGVIPLLHAHLDRLGLKGTVPEDVWRRLAERRERSTRHGLLLTLELSRMLAALEDAGIPGLPLKGASVARRLYPELGLRESGDLDLMVPAHQVMEAIALVLSFGYRPWEPLPKAPGDIRFRTEYSVSFTHPDSDIDVDLHWNFARSVFPTGLSPDVMFERATETTLQGRTVRALSWEDLLLVLSIHGCKHGPTPWPRLKWVGDLAAFLARCGELDWDEAFRAYRAARGDAMVLVGLGVTERLLGCPLPGPVDVRLRRAARVPAAVTACADAVLQRRGGFTLAERVRFDLAVQTRAADRLRVLWTRLLTPTKRDRDEMPVPDRLSWLYLPVRGLRLLRQYALRPLGIRKLWRRDPS